MFDLASQLRVLYELRPQDPAIATHRLVFYSSSDPRKKANAALLMALYVVSPPSH